MWPLLCSLKVHSPISTRTISHMIFVPFLTLGQYQQLSRQGILLNKELEAENLAEGCWGGVLWKTSNIQRSQWPCFLWWGPPTVQEQGVRERFITQNVDWLCGAMMSLVWGYFMSLWVSKWRFLIGSRISRSGSDKGFSGSTVFECSKWKASSVEAEGKQQAKEKWKTKIRRRWQHRKNNFSIGIGIFHIFKCHRGL